MWGSPTSDFLTEIIKKYIREGLSNNECAVLIIIGYSFSDPHINMLIKEYTSFDKTKVLVIDSIEDNAFYGCYSLKVDVLEDCSNSIGMGTSGYDKKSLFYDCPLEKVYIGRNMASSYWVGNRNDYLPFYGKETIKELTLGSDVTNLWAYSFYGCNAIEDITVKHDIPIMLENYTFSSELYSKCRLNVPVNSVSLYSSA